MALFLFIIVFYVALRATAAINHNTLHLQHSNVHRQRTFCWFPEAEVFKQAAAAVTVNADRGHCITGAPLWDTGHLTEQKRGRLGQGWEVKGGYERIQQEENWGSRNARTGDGGDNQCYEEMAVKALVWILPHSLAHHPLWISFLSWSLWSNKNRKPQLFFLQPFFTTSLSPTHSLSLCHCLTSILLPFFIPIMRGWVQAICFHSSRAVPLVTSRGIAFLCMQLVTGVVMLSLSFSLSPLASISVQSPVQNAHQTGNKISQV